MSPIVTLNTESKVMSKYIEVYGKQSFAVNLKYPSKAIQEAKKCSAYFSLIENGLFGCQTGKAEPIIAYNGWFKWLLWPLPRQP